jgi:hypothetical protein
MIKVVATKGGAAVEALIAEGLNINITLIFSLRNYEAVAEAYIRGFQRCASPASVASVASFFVSRVYLASQNSGGLWGSRKHPWCFIATTASIRYFLGPFGPRRRPRWCEKQQCVIFVSSEHCGSAAGFRTMTERRARADRS